jgi:hypothetical protein
LLFLLPANTHATTGIGFQLLLGNAGSATTHPERLPLNKRLPRQASSQV